MKNSSGLSVKLLLLILAIFPLGQAFSHGGSGSIVKHPNLSQAYNGSPVKFIENKNQWDSKVEYKLELNYGAMFFEKNALTYSFYDAADIEAIKDAKTGKSINGSYSNIVDAHAFKVDFKGANSNVNIAGSAANSNYSNYYIGNDPSKWASNVNSYGEIYYSDLYNGVDLKFYSTNDPSFGPLVKYDFIVHAHNNPNQINLVYNGLDRVYVQNGNLYLKNSINSVIEQQPYAYQMINGSEVAVPCNYKLLGNELTFEFPSGYNSSYDLIIDPVLEFSTYTGSTSDNFGFTATYDQNGDLYAGGIVFGVGYPVTLGAFQVNYSGQVDVSITKFTPDGSALVYSTYLGGSNTETPSSLVVNNNNELVVMGTTGSSNFPTAVGSFDRSFNGGTTASFPNNGAEFSNGTDIFISKFNSTGTALLGSTYMGGTNNDGINHNSSSQLQYNYGDQFRGEVIVDNQDNIYVASSTLSFNFPVTGGVFQPFSSGGQEAVVFKLNSNLSTLIWSSYMGGSGVDAGYSVKLDNNNDLLLCGGTTSSNLFNTGGALNSTYRGGNADGFVCKINNSGTQLIRTSYIGTSSYDQTYFVETDRFNNVYLYGQTRGTYPTTAGVYSNAGTKQFIHKLNSDLSSTVFSTTFGSGTIVPNLSPTAFLVDLCGFIYVSGWGGNVNTSWNSLTGTTNNMPLTFDAYQSTTDGSDFYFLVLGPDASFLEYATYFGGFGSDEHVDGGTSRFDKRGAIYQAVCAGCGGNSLFPTTPGVWSTTNNSFNCNLGALKFNFELNSVTVDVSASSTDGCSPLTVLFDDNEITAKSYLWDFGDGNTSNIKSPSYTFNQPGTYEVKLIGYDSTSCVGVTLTDTALVTVEVFESADTSINVSICDGDSYFAGGAQQTTSGVYSDTLITFDGCDSVVTTNLTVLPNSSSTDNVSICDGESHFVGGAQQTTSGTYTDTYVSSNGCDSVVTTNLTVLPNSSSTDNVIICDGESHFAGGAQQTTSGTYTDTFVSSNGCDSVVTTNLTVLPNSSSTDNVIICDGESHFAGGALQTTSGTYTDTYISSNGCDSVVTTNLTVLPNSSSTDNVSICDGESYFAGGALQTTSGIYTDTLVAANGCDSIVTTNLSVLTILTSTDNVSICDGESYFAGGAQQTTSGTYTDTLISSSSCDSVVTTNLTVLPNSSSTDNVSICDGESHFAGGAQQTTSGTYTDTLISSSGCDSVVTTNLTVLPNSSSTDNVSICDGESHFAGGALQTTSGTYTDTYVSSNGCDSVVTTNLTVLPNSSSTDNVSICDGESHFAGGALQTTSGTYTDTYVSSNGCDSVVTTNLTVLPNSSSTDNVSICDGESHFAGGALQTTSGTYTDTYVSSNGCDSVVTTNLTVLPNSSSTDNLSICDGESHFAGGALQTTSGTYTDTYVSSNGCDSVVTTNLTVLPNSSSMQYVSICDGESYFVGGAQQTTAGVYTDVYPSFNGCDSTVTTELKILPNTSFTQNVSICSGDSYFVGGAQQTTAGTYVDTLVNFNGCDSILTTNLSLLPVYTSSVDTNVCLGDPFRGVYYNSDTVLIDSLLTVDGCDSVITNNVFVEQCCPIPVLLCEDTVNVDINQDYCGAFNLNNPGVDSPCNIVSLTNDYTGGPFPEGATTVTWIAVDQYGQSDTCEQTVVYQPTTLLSSYTLLAEEQVYLLPTNDVRTGAVGVLSSTGDAYLQNHTMVTGANSFVSAPIITTFPNTQVSNPIYSPANVTLPAFEPNPVPNSGVDVTVSTNQTAILTDTVYGRIRLFKGARVIFDNPYGVLNVNEIRVNNKAAGAFTVLEFKQCTKVRVKNRVDLGPRCTVNPDSLNVIFYVEAANTDAKDNQPSVDIGPRALVYADFYVPNGRFYAHPGTNVDPARYYGTYIAKWINGDPDIVWRRKSDCDYTYSCPGIQLNKYTGIEESLSQNVMFESYPNPFEQSTTIKFTATNSNNRVSLKVFDTSGKLVTNLFEGEIVAGQTNTVVFDASLLSYGMYYTVLQTSEGNYYKKLIHIR